MQVQDEIKICNNTPTKAHPISPNILVHEPIAVVPLTVRSTKCRSLSTESHIKSASRRRAPGPTIPMSMSNLKPVLPTVYTMRSHRKNRKQKRIQIATNGTADRNRHVQNHPHPSARKHLSYGSRCTSNNALHLVDVIPVANDTTHIRTKPNRYLRIQVKHQLSRGTNVQTLQRRRKSCEPMPRNPRIDLKNTSQSPNRFEKH